MDNKPIMSNSIEMDRLRAENKRLKDALLGLRDEVLSFSNEDGSWSEAVELTDINRVIKELGIEPQAGMTTLELPGDGREFLNG